MPGADPHPSTRMPFGPTSFLSELLFNTFSINPNYVVKYFSFIYAQKDSGMRNYSHTRHFRSTLEFRQTGIYLALGHTITEKDKHWGKRFIYYGHKAPFATFYPSYPNKYNVVTVFTIHLVPFFDVKMGSERMAKKIKVSNISSKSW